MTMVEDLKARQLIINLLADPAVTNLSFTVGRWSIKSDFYAKVSKAISDSDVTVVVDPNLTTMSGAGAAYYH